MNYNNLISKNECCLNGYIQSISVPLNKGGGLFFDL